MAFTGILEQTIRAYIHVYRVEMCAFSNYIKHLKLPNHKRSVQEGITQVSSNYFQVFQS